MYSVPVAPLPEHLDLGHAEHELRSAVRSAAEALGALPIGDFLILRAVRESERLAEATVSLLLACDAPTSREQALRTAGIDPTRRAETLSSVEFAAIERALGPVAK